jgi:AcrR family transcriptional regulator
MAGSDAQRPARRGLRELKKRRLKAQIVRVAVDLFTKQGFGNTTLTEIAAAAEIVPSTLHSYFPSKRDIVFHRHRLVLESARARILDRPLTETAIHALEGWVEVDLPALADSDFPPDGGGQAIIDANDELMTEERLQLALLEDVFAEAFARDLGESSDDLASRLMAAVTLAVLRAIFKWSYQHPRDGTFDFHDAYELDGRYLTKMLAAAEAAIERIPKPPLDPPSLTSLDADPTSAT